MRLLPRILANGCLPPRGERFARADPGLMVQLGHGGGVGKDEELFVGPQGVGAGGQEFFTELSYLGTANTQAREGLLVFGVEAFFAKERDMDGVDIRVQHRLGEARALGAGFHLTGFLEGVHARPQFSQFNRRGSFLWRDEKTRAAGVWAPTRAGREEGSRG